MTLIGSGLDQWASAIFDDYDYLTGYSLAHEWQMRYGALSARDRLMPKLPFVLGGKFELANLIAVDSAQSMRIRGNLATQIHTLPDGAKIEFKVVD